MWNATQHKPLIHVKIRMNLKIIKLSERSQKIRTVWFPLHELLESIKFEKMQITEWSVAVWGQGGAGGGDYQDALGNIWRWWKCSVSWLSAFVRLLVNFFQNCISEVSNLEITLSWLISVDHNFFFFWRYNSDPV